MSPENISVENSFLLPENANITETISQTQGGLSRGWVLQLEPGQQQRLQGTLGTLLLAAAQSRPWKPTGQK